MKTKRIIMMVVGAFVCGAIFGISSTSSLMNRKHQTWLLIVALNDVMRVYEPLKMLSEGETTQAQSLLLSALGDSIKKYDNDAYLLPEWGHVEIVVNAHALL